jgi:cysteine desulfurase
VTAYLDHAATTPILPEAVAAMTQQLVRTGNPSSLHSAGRAARRIVEEAREGIAEALGARPSEVVFTAGGTEADNLAVIGLYGARRRADPQRNLVVISAIEHHAVLDPALWLAKHEGAEVVLLPVDETGRIRLADLGELLEREHHRVALISVMWANNEVGTIQPVREVVALAQAHRIPVHTDAVQAAGHLPVNFGGSGTDCLTVTAHKLGGPVGAGALLVRRDLELDPLTHGGGQERGLRSGTPDAAALAAFAAAVQVSVASLPESSLRIAALRDQLVRAVLNAVPDAVLRGDPAPGGRLPGTALFTFPSCEGDSLLYLLDARGVECSTGSACQAGVPQPSHVLLAMGVPEEQARGALRFSLGHSSVAADVDALAAVIGPVVERARSAGLTAGVS